MKQYNQVKNEMLKLFNDVNKPLLSQ